MVINVLPGNCDLQNFATNNSKLVLFLPGAYSLKFILMLYIPLPVHLSCQFQSHDLLDQPAYSKQNSPAHCHCRDPECSFPPASLGSPIHNHSTYRRDFKKNLLLRVFIAIIWQRHFILSICTGTALGISKAKFKWWL